MSKVSFLSSSFTSPEEQGKKIIAAFSVIVVIGLFSLFAYSISVNGKFYSVFPGGVMMGAASLMVGLFFGFLFGIPKTSDELPPSNAQNGDSPDGKNRLSTFRQNTNLEQISDWLTKMLVGVGLTQITSIPIVLPGFAKSLGEALDGTRQAEIFGVCIVIYSSISGFIFGYIVTRFYMANALNIIQKGYQDFFDKVKEQFEETKLVAKNAAVEVQAKVEEAKQVAMNIASESQEAGEKSSRVTIVKMMYAGLYAAEGYKQTIQLANQYFKDYGKPEDAAFWTNLAAAYGQQYKFEKARQASPATLETIRGKVLEAINEALRIDSGTAKPWLQYIWDPNYVGKNREDEEDDLEDFYDDEEFKRLLA